MSEEISGSESGGPDPVATSLALGRGSPAVDSEIVAFLHDQRSHLHEQARHLREQLGLKLWELRMGVVLRVATAVVGIVMAVGVAAMVWDAAHSKGLIIEPFSVPPVLRERGLSGEVIASQMIDRLTHMTKTESSRAVQSYANNWGNDIKVEIPETGISIGELRRFLNDWLGHDIRISGEVYKTADGIAVTARTSGEEGATFTGKEGDLDTLVQQAAEHVYEVTQPYRYANYLDRNYDPKGLEQRVAKASAIYRKLIAGDDKLERAWAYNGLGTIEFRFHADDQKAIYYYRKALAEKPDLTIAIFALAARGSDVGSEEEYRHNQEASRQFQSGEVSDLNPRYATYARLTTAAALASLKGDYATAIPLQKAGAALPDEFSVLARAGYIRNALANMSRRHDPGAVRAYLHELDWREIPALSFPRFAYDLERQDWQDVLLQERVLQKQIADTTGAAHKITLANFYFFRPAFALAYAQLGDFAGAEAMVAPLRGDYEYGLQARARIAELRGQRVRADFWFARWEKQTPSFPFADAFWGQALLERGKPDAAIEKFKLANQKGPKFADPLEGWGEALMAKNQSHLALEKFAQAEKYAPNWGRLHLKWGEALIYAGKPAEAKAQFARAAALDLTPSEKSELAGMRP